MDIKSTITLNNGVEIPRFGLGVWQIEDGNQTAASVKEAIKVGYKLIDTAAIYGNEKGVGEGIKGVKREELFVTTKVWNGDQGYDSTLRAVEKSLKKLGLEFVDLYLVHWPVAGKLQDTWRAMEELYKNGLAKAIGVSNFNEYHFEEIAEIAEIRPAVNQIEIHPFLTQESTRAYCKKEGIAVQAYSPLGRGGALLQTPQIAAIAKNHNKTAAQVILRWHLQNDIIAIPKSTHAERIKENASIFDFELSAVEIGTINALNKNEKIIKNLPFTFDKHGSIVL